jgi:hypothetical protein
MRTRARRRAASALAAVVILASALSGCSWLFPPPPPEAAVSSLEAMRGRIAAVDGITDVKTSLYSTDYRDGPDPWIAQVDATADAPDPAVAGSVRDALGDGVTQAELVLSLALPAGDGAAPAMIDPRDPVSTDLAEVWRRIPGVASVDVTDSDRSVELEQGTTFAAAADLLRPTLADGEVRIRRGTTSVDLSTAAPARSVLDLVERLDARPDVSDLSISPRSAPARGIVAVESEDPAGLAAVLAATPDEAADAGTAPRTIFFVRAPYSTAADTEAQITGWLGLPLGSPEPDDLPDASETSTPAAPTTPAPPYDLVDVSAQEAGVRAFLEAAAATTGVPAEVTTVATQCEDGSAGTQATGSVLIPIFTVMDEPQPPFDAITRSWTDDGFVVGGRAMGRDFWTAGDGRADGVASASIRGTADGLSLSAESVCVR